MHATSTPMSSFAEIDLNLKPMPMLGEYYFDRGLNSPLVLFVVLVVWYAKLAVDLVALDSAIQRSVFLSHLLVDIGLVTALYHLYHNSHKR